MMKSVLPKLIFIGKAYVVSLSCFGLLFGGEPSAFAPAFFDPGRDFGNSSTLHVFPLQGTAFTLPLPFKPGVLAFSPDGTLYGSRFYDPSGANTGLYKIEFNPTRASKVPGSEGLSDIYSIGASSTKIVVSGGYFGQGRVSRCGLYELSLATGDVRQILSNSDCKYGTSWQSISLSPDSRKVVAVREHDLELIDTETKTVRSLGGSFRYTAWSPDGRWIAAEQGDHTALINAFTLIKQKTLHSSEALWSPDSHFILTSSSHVWCGAYRGTLGLIDTASGRTKTIRSSICRIYSPVFGWMKMPALR